MTLAEKRCPEHSEPGADLFEAWPCPMDCKHFVEELERRLDDVRVKGNFTRMTKVDGVMHFQTFRNHVPIDDPTPRV